MCHRQHGCREELSKPTRLQITVFYHEPQMLDTELQHLVSSLLGFSPAMWSDLSSLNLHSSLLKWKCLYPALCVSEVSNL